LFEQVMFWVSRKLGQLAEFAGSKIGNASVIGGRVALKIFPRFLQQARKKIDFPIIFVMGSNGKTTTSKYVVDLAEAQGEVVLNNNSGSNMTTGIASLVISAWREILNKKYTLGIFEIDEGYAETMAKDLLPEHAAVLNVQIDQIYRLHEPERVADMFSRTMSYVQKNIIVNGNDEMLVSAVEKSPLKATVSYFGLDGDSYSELGLFRPIRLRQGNDVFSVQKSDANFKISLDKDSHDLVPPSSGLHFAMNGAAAIAVAIRSLASNASIQLLADTLAKSKPAFGRGESITSGSAQFDVILFKNRSSLQLNLNSVRTPATTIVLAFDEYSQDPSWLFAIDYSSLPKVDYVSGEKADFLELALEYAGIPVGKRIESIKDVVQEIETKYKDLPNPSLHRMYLDYDQMIATRDYFGLKIGKTS